MPYLNRTIYMPQELLMAFSKHTGLFWSGIEIEGAICDAIEAAMQPQTGQARAQALQDATASGYQWKQVFLPEGTVLRASFDRQPYYAVVEGSAIKYGQYNLSPSAFANLQGSGNRNAWKAVWLRFPGSPDWVRADECRAVRKALTARLFAPNQPDDAGQPQPARRVGCREQHYTDDKPSKNDAVPFHQLLKDFPETVEEVEETADDACAASDVNPLSASQPLHPEATSPGDGIKPRKVRRLRKGGKRQAACGKRHQSS
jgi:hypothetical protein